MIFMGGIRGSLSSKVTFNASFSQQKMEGLPLYIKDYEGLGNKFLITYDTVNISTITGELAYQKIRENKSVIRCQIF